MKTIPVNIATILSLDVWNRNIGPRRDGDKNGGYARSGLLLMLIFSMTACSEAPTVRELAQRAADRFQGKLPLRIDPLTTIYSAVAAGDRLQIRYRVDTRKAGASKLLTEEYVNNYLRPHLVDLDCNTKALSYYLKRGVNFRHSYSDENDAFLFSIRITKEDC